MGLGPGGCPVSYYGYTKEVKECRCSECGGEHPVTVPDSTRYWFVKDDGTRTEVSRELYRANTP